MQLTKPEDHRPGASSGLGFAMRAGAELGAAIGALLAIGFGVDPTHDWENLKQWGVDVSAFAIVGTLGGLAVGGISDVLSPKATPAPKPEEPEIVPKVLDWGCKDKLDCTTREVALVGLMLGALLGAMNAFEYLAFKSGSGSLLEDAVDVLVKTATDAVIGTAVGAGMGASFDRAVKQDIFSQLHNGWRLGLQFGAEAGALFGHYIMTRAEQNELAWLARRRPKEGRNATNGTARRLEFRRQFTGLKLPMIGEIKLDVPTGWRAAWRYLLSKRGDVVRSLAGVLVGAAFGADAGLILGSLYDQFKHG